MLSKHHAFRLYRAAVLMLTFDVNVNDDNFLTKKNCLLQSDPRCKGDQVYGSSTSKKPFCKI